MYVTPHCCPQFLDGLKAFIAWAKTDMQARGKSTIFCPCRDCINVKQFSNADIVHAHLIIRGFKENYFLWNKHGEEGPMERQDTDGGQERTAHTGGQERTANAGGQERTAHADEENFDDEDFDVINDEGILDFDDDIDALLDNVDEMIHDVRVEDELTDAELRKFRQFVEDSKKPLYPNCERYSRVTGDLKLLQLKAAHGWTDKSFKALLLLLKDMLPEGNLLPVTVYEAKKIVCPIGLKIEKIHACKESCVLFRGDNADLDRCPECGITRYKRRKDGGDDGEESKKGNPRKVAWYFPIIPRLKRLFANKDEAKLMRWHEEGRKKDDTKIRHPADCAQWRNIDTTFPMFGDDCRNIRFQLSTDGMNPYGNMSTTHSTWPVLLSILNLPPWLCNKRKYIMLSTLVSGPNQPGDRIDVYLRPLIDDMKKLWEGVPQVRDAYSKDRFTLRAMVFTTVSDLPAHRNLSGQSKRKGQGCPHCLDDTCAVWLRNSNKFAYMGHRRFLPMKHPYRNMAHQFDGTRERREPPQHVSGSEVYDQVKDMAPGVLGKRKRAGNGQDEEELGIWNKISLLWELEYWQMLAVRHSIDNMHLKKNICESLVGTFLNTKGKGKDHENARADLQEMGIRPELYAEETEYGHDLPVAATTMSKKERKEFCEFLHGVKFPSGYGSNFARLVNAREMKVNFSMMKSHDCHVLMTSLLPVAIRNVLPVKVREAVMSLCFFFNAIEQKVIDDESLVPLQKQLVETLCLLEAFFPPTFFDIMVHLTVHLVEEIHYLGPTYLHQMFPYERFMGILKSFVHIHTYPEGNIVSRYGTEEAVEWSMAYLDPENPIGVAKSRHEGRLAGIGHLGKRTVNPDQDSFRKAHFHVLQHMEVVEPYVMEHKQMLAEQNSERGEAWVAKEHMKRFTMWFKDRVSRDRSTSLDEMIRKLAAGPLFTVTTYEGYDINGFTFYTLRQDEKSIYQNSSVRIDAYDNNMERAAYYGQIEEIWELNYLGFKVALFKCRWVQGSTGVSRDKNGFVSVDLQHVGFKSEPFVLAKEVLQIFYVRDTVRKKRHIALPGKKRIVGVQNAVDEEEFNQFDEIPPFASCALPRLSVNDKTPYLRTDHNERIRVRKNRRGRVSKKK